MNDNILIIGLVFAIAFALIVYVFSNVGKKTLTETHITEAVVVDLLNSKIDMYQNLSVEDKSHFLERVLYFLQTTKITAAKGAIVTDEDRILVAVSATIPLFHFKTWAYENLDEVLIYPNYFDDRFGVEDDSNNISGMVGDGVLNHKMILSLHALRAGFNKHLIGNTAIHEFVHLIDKADGAVDGVPEYLIPHDLIGPWVKEMERTIKEIRQGNSDIREYGGTNEAEFLAVVSEYFFKKPKMLKEDHPKLYELLNQIYTRE